MKKLLIFMCLFLLVGCSSKDESISYNTISVDEAKYIIDNESDEFIIDVRTKEEYDTGHLVNSINIPYDSISDFKGYSEDLESIIIVYCKTGVRAKKASETLVKMGYKNVYTFGGIDSWTYDIE